LYCNTNVCHLGYTSSGSALHTGAAVNHICLPTDPTWNARDGSYAYHAYIYGTEYESGTANTNAFGSDLVNHNAPCAVCRSTARPTAMMLPGRHLCYPGWTTEYHGYLMAGDYHDVSGTEFICVDGAPESEPQDSRHDTDTGKLFVVEADCETSSSSSSLTCPPYIAGREITCSVCTK
jgi:hypothetical protein